MRRLVPHALVSLALSLGCSTSDPGGPNANVEVQFYNYLQISPGSVTISSPRDPDVTLQLILGVPDRANTAKRELAAGDRVDFRVNLVGSPIAVTGFCTTDQRGVDLTYLRAGLTPNATIECECGSQEFPDTPLCQP